MAKRTNQSSDGFDKEVEYLGGWNETGTRTPQRFRQRVLDTFRAPPNLEYLAGLFKRKLGNGPLLSFALDTLTDSIYSFGQGEVLIYSDPLAQRGDSRPASGIWSEVRRLNLAFYEYRMKFLRDKASLLSGVSTDGQWNDDEPYHYRMFVSDSLRPPGLEHLNSTGPLYEILENQTLYPMPMVPPQARRKVGWPQRPGGRPTPKSEIPTFHPQKKEGFVSVGARTSTRPAPKNSYLLNQRNISSSQINPSINSDDWGWDGGNPNRTPEQAMEEYWGNSRVETSTQGASQFGGETYSQRFGMGDRWRENGGTRFMRYPTIPIWQNLSRGRNYDRDIEETLGTGSREQPNQIRRWNLDRIRNKRGEEYRTYGWRSTSTV